MLAVFTFCLHSVTSKSPATTITTKGFNLLWLCARSQAKPQKHMEMCHRHSVYTFNNMNMTDNNETISGTFGFIFLLKL